jgi:hypothetical protein
VNAYDPIIALVGRANPIDPAGGADLNASSDSQQLLAAIRQSAATPAGPFNRPRGSARRWRSALMPIVSVVVVIAVVAAVIRVNVPRDRARDVPASGSKVTITVRARPTPQVPRLTAVAIAPTIQALRVHLAAVASHVSVRLGANATIRINATGSRAAILQATLSLPHLYFYDWEATTLTPRGSSVASGLPSDPSSVAISQGGSADPGVGAAVKLEPAVRLASRMPAVRLSSAHLSRAGPEYYQFDRHGRLVAGPATRRSTLRPSRNSTVLTVPQGWLIVQSLAPVVPPSARTATFYVLRDDVGLFGDTVTDPHLVSTPGTGDAVAFGFDKLGREQFQALTQTIAHRASSTSPQGPTPQNQHFALVLDGRLLAVRAVDFKTYPDGIHLTSARNAYTLAGGTAPKDAATLVAQLREGALAVPLQVVRIAG